MSVASSSATLQDPWDYPVPLSNPPLSRKSNEPVPDDWDNDDEEEEEEEEEPHKVWEVANRKAPMPELVISSTSTTSSMTPPPAAIMPAIRILKRPSSTSAYASSSPSEMEQKSYAEREAQYQAARQRIFGTGSPSSSGNNSDNDTSRKGFPALGSDNGAQCTPSTIIRNPTGPSQSLQGASQSSNDTGVSKGFNRRKSVPMH